MGVDLPICAFSLRGEVGSRGNANVELRNLNVADVAD